MNFFQMSSVYHGEEINLWNDNFCSLQVITATPRQIESLIRLSEALARIRFSDLVGISFLMTWETIYMATVYKLLPPYMQVEKRDVIEAFRLLEVAMQQSATDHSTGSYFYPN